MCKSRRGLSPIHVQRSFTAQVKWGNLYHAHCLSEGKRAALTPLWIILRPRCFNRNLAGRKKWSLRPEWMRDLDAFPCDTLAHQVFWLKSTWLAFKYLWSGRETCRTLAEFTACINTASFRWRAALSASRLPDSCESQDNPILWRMKELSSH